MTRARRWQLQYGHARAISTISRVRKRIRKTSCATVHEACPVFDVQRLHQRPGHRAPADGVSERFPLVKPFALQELHARLRALYKRSHRNTDTVLTVGDLTLNRSTLQVQRAGRRVELNPAGMRLLQRLMEESPSVVTRDDLETLLWADARPDGDGLRSHMYKLRQAVDRPFDSPLIHTVHRIGYRIAEDGR